MARTCVVCAHSELEAIDQVLVVAGESNRRVASHHGLSEASVRRHKANHLPETLIQAQDVAEVVRADTLLDQVKNLQGKALSILAKAESAGDLRTALAGVREGRSCLELLARLSGELANRNVTINTGDVYNTNELTVILVGLPKVLAPYPDARDAVVQWLGTLEAGDSSSGGDNVQAGG